MAERGLSLVDKVATFYTEAVDTGGDFDNTGNVLTLLGGSFLPDRSWEVAQYSEIRLSTVANSPMRVSMLPFMD